MAYQHPHRWQFRRLLEDVLDQAAVAWGLGCVFVRFCEDNGLFDGLCIGGPEPHLILSWEAPANMDNPA
ncbi:MAG TPA: hypothetical protein VFX60_13645 [Micromonospora sp.]|nr:hypothetical protein [Micromonospora sp.]